MIISFKSETWTKAVQPVINFTKKYTGWSNPLLGGIRFDVLGDDLTMYATDGSVLTAYKVPCMIEGSVDGEYVLDLRAIKTTKKSIINMTFDLEARTVKILDTNAPVARYELKLMEGSFPRAEKIVPDLADNSDAEFSISTEVFQKVAILTKTWDNMRLKTNKKFYPKGMVCTDSGWDLTVIFMPSRLPGYDDKD